jgi:hypothetical protein
MEKKNIITYVGFAIAIFAVATGVFGWVPAEVAWGIAGLFGFGTLAAVRTFIDSKGWKTYLIDIPTALAGLATALGWLSLELYQQIMVVIGMLNVGTIRQADTKALTG